MVGIRRRIDVSTAFLYRRCSRLICIVLGISAYVARSPALGVSDASPVELVYSQYVRETADRGSAATSREFLLGWATQFHKVLDATTAGTSGRLRMLDELGAIDGNLGNRDEAKAIYSQMENEAIASADKSEIIVALSNQWSYSSSDIMAERLKIADRLDKAFQAAIDAKPTSDTLVASYSDALFNRGLAVLEYVNQMKRDDNDSKGALSAAAKDLVSQATSDLNRSVILIDSKPGREPPLNKLFYLAQAESKRGNGQRAVEIYNRMLSSDQHAYSRMWLAHLKTRALYANNTEAYQRELEAILKEFDHRDEYCATLEQDLGLSYYHTGRFNDAVGIFEQLVGVAAGPDVTATNLYLLAESYEGAGKPDMAKTVMTELSATYPNSGAGRDAVKYLENQRVSTQPTTQSAAQLPN